MINRVLLVWNEVPENLKLFELNLTDKEYEKILQCHGLYINSSEMDGEQERAMNWLQYIVDNEEPFYNENTKTMNPLKYTFPATVIVSGFLL